MQSGLERGFRYFKVSPIKAFRDIRHVSVDKVLATGRETLQKVSARYSIFGNRMPFIEENTTWF